MSPEQSRCIDGLLWVGQSYPRFFCGERESCLDPDRPQGPHCFVHEAEQRGVSRRVPYPPPWAVPGQTRIFLAHRGGEKEGSKGRIFGYFVLERIEVLSDADGPAATPKAPSQLPAASDGNGRRNGKRGEREGSGGRRPVPRKPEEEDGGGPSMSDLVEILLEDETVSEHRGCSLREKPGAVYLVDGLEAEIADAFHHRLHRVPVDRRLKAGRKLFNRVVEETVRERAAGARVPRALRGKARVRGEIVLFDDPPLLEREPRASFRGLIHIDGDHLLDQIAEGVAKPSIRACRRAGALTSRRGMAAVLAERTHANESFADHLLVGLGDLAREEMTSYGRFRLPGVGTLRRGSNGQIRFRADKDFP